jgi:hypothetical protein
MSSFHQKNNPKRHKLIAPKVLKQPRGLDAKTEEDVPAINTLESLKEHLQIAIELEHSTLPPYLTTLYSIKDGSNQTAVAAIRSVAIEEMLHMIMVCNILNAIGGAPNINHKDFIPTYPGPLPHSDDSFQVSLAKFSPETIDIFLKIEKPAPAGSPPQAHDYSSIGQFYQAIMDGMDYVNTNTEGGIFLKDKTIQARQVTAEHYYGSGGVLVAVYCIEDARLAMEEIVGQGEGIDDTIFDGDHELFGEDMEYAHYFRFNEIACGQAYLPTDSAHDPPSGPPIDVDWEAVYNMKANPKLSDYKVGSELWTKTYEFNKTYMLLLNNLHDACNGCPELLRTGINVMYDLKYKALELYNIPIGKGMVAGPTFEYVE